MAGDGIDKTGEKETVGQIGCHLTSLRKRSCHNCNGRRGKGILEKEKGKINISRPKKVGSAGKGGSPKRLLVTPKGKCVTHGKVGKGGAASVYSVNETT